MGHTQKSIAHLISEELEIPQETGRRFLQRVIDIISDDIVYTGRIELRGIGSFSVTTRPPVHTTHPTTGKPVSIPEKKIVKFRTSSLIKKRLNPKEKTRTRKSPRKKLV